MKNGATRTTAAPAHNGAVPRRVLVRSALAAVCLAGALAAVVTYVSQVKTQQTFELRRNDFARALELVHESDTVLNPSIVRDTAEAVSLRHTGHGAQAERVMRDAVRDWPLDVVRWFVLTRIQLGHGDPGAARRSYRRARQLDPHLSTRLPAAL
jgi:cytochrome c-type biogenesis protein CcmH/NrfG